MRVWRTVWDQMDDSVVAKKRWTTEVTSSELGWYCRHYSHCSLLGRRLKNRALVLQNRLELLLKLKGRLGFLVSQKFNGDYSNGDTNEFLDEINGEIGLNLSNGDEHDMNVMTNNAINSSHESSETIREVEPKEEPEKIKKWREEQNRLLEEKDREESVRKEELKQTAKHELEEWYARYAEQLEKSKLNNRNAEKEWVAERDTEVAGQEWEKIAKMCDFNPKSTRNTKDTTRMRSILLQLKQNPPTGQNSKS
ncbi:unnamed protein product [Medioppia subpectinata]|uniref:Clathrin light chain n=1 Tax=Medioppia subpectinata TaxID=1979941 RepID=A0A7R9KEV9_9ACAR|nr:unnamed protein product [Medioppia subpectinata]CAG2102266.1 unnamed protein product [Medioppia subpectinata]